MQVGVLTIHPWSPHEEGELIRKIVDVNRVANLNRLICSHWGCWAEEDVSNWTYFAIVAISELPFADCRSV